MNLKSFINDEKFFNNDYSDVNFKTKVETIEKIYKKFYDQDNLQKKLTIQSKLSEISWLTTSELTKYELLKSKLNYIDSRNSEQKKLEKLRLDSNLSVDNHKKYQKFLSELKFTQEIEISESEKKEFEKLEIKLKSREQKIFNEIDFESHYNLVNLLFLKWKYELDFRNKKEQIIFESIFSLLEKEELHDLLVDFSNFWIVKFENDQFENLVTQEEFTFNELFNLIFDFILVVIYYNQVENFEFKDVELENLKQIENSFWWISNVIKEKNLIFINDFFDSVFKNLKKSENLKKIIRLKDFCKNLSNDFNFEDELKGLEKEIYLKNKDENTKKKVSIMKWKRIHNILYSNYQNYSRNLNREIWNYRLLNVDYSFIPLVKMFVNIWLFEKQWFLFKVKEEFNLKRWFFLEFLTNVSEIIYRKFEEELPWPLLENWIWLIWRFKDWKKKSFSLINSFWIEFIKFETFKENLLDKWYVFIEKNSLWQNKDIFVFIKENWKNTNENVIMTQLIKKFEEDLMKNNDFKSKEFKSSKVESKSDILKKAIEEMQQRKEILEKQEIQEENFWNVENINETFNWRIFYWIHEENEFIRIWEDSLSEAYWTVKFFTYVFKKEEHWIADYQSDIAILYDKQVQRKELFISFLKYLSDKNNKNILKEIANFFYSKVIWTVKEVKYQELRKFFKPIDDYIILKAHEIVDPSKQKIETKYVWWFNYENLIESFWLSIQLFWEFMNSDEWQKIWRYNIYSKKQSKTSWIKYFLFTRKVISDRQTYEDIFSTINKKHNLEIEWIH